MWRMEWISEDCQWVIRSPLGIILARTYNRKVARQLLNQFLTECPWGESNDGKEKTKNEEEDIRSDDQ